MSVVPPKSVFLWLFSLLCFDHLWVPVRSWGLVLCCAESTTYFLDSPESWQLISAGHNSQRRACSCGVGFSHSLPEQISHFLFYLTFSYISFLFLPGLQSLATFPISSSLKEQIVSLGSYCCLFYPYFTSCLSLRGLFTAWFLLH